MAITTGTRPPGSVGLLVLSLILVFGGGYLAHRVQTDAGRVDVRAVRFVTPDGALMSAHLYLPATATVEAPAPGVLAVHGYINSKETQSPYAIEYARRGYVVLAIDQRGHGYSDPPAFAAGYGGPAGLSFLRDLPMVDDARIALEGHSMGGWAVLIAADEAPEAYESVILSGSSTGTLGAPEGTTAFPRNLGLVFSLYDEFSELMWGASTGAEVTTTEKLQTLFGTDAPVEAGVVYGDLDDGTARWLAQPPVTHPGDHITGAGIAPTIEWLQRTVPAPNPLAPADQVWVWKELGTGLGFLGMVLSFFAAGGLLLRVPAFETLERVPARALESGATGWWFAALATVAVPIVTYFWFQNRAAEWLPVSEWFPQEISNGVAVWAVANAGIALAIWLFWYSTAGRRGGTAGVGLGGGVLRSLGLAAATIGTGYLLLLASVWIFDTDFRVWVLVAKPLSAVQARAMLSYLLPLGFYFVVLGLVLHGQLRPPGRTPLGAAVFGNGVLMGAGFAALLLIQYIPLFGGQPLPLGEPLLTILAIQFLVLLPIAGMLSTYFFHHTGRIWPGAFASTLFVAWYLVASQATHVAY